MKRLTSAGSATSGTQTFQYHGFGNLTAKVLNGTSTPIPVNPATNQLTNAYYDANGNMTSGAGATFTYDEANRVTTVTETSGGEVFYGYDASNKRIYIRGSDVQGGEVFTFYGVKGENLGKYGITNNCAGYTNAICFQPQVTNLYFAGRLVMTTNGGTASAVYQDRLGTNRQTGTYYPYGDGTAGSDTFQFATYTRDSYTGIDYADQRFYASSYGRFNTPDPYQASGGPNSPASWNRYSYTRGDPVSRFDPTGQFDDDPEDPGGPGSDAPIQTGSKPGASPPTAPSPSVVKYASQAHLALNYEIAHLTPNCKKVLPNAATLTADASDLNYWDGRVEGAVQESVIPGVAPTAPTIGIDLGDNNAITLLGPNGTISYQVVLGQGFFDEPPTDQGITLLHELLHYALQAIDVDIAKQLNIDTSYYSQIFANPTVAASYAFTKWLDNDCKN